MNPTREISETQRELRKLLLQTMTGVGKSKARSTVDLAYGDKDSKTYYLDREKKRMVKADFHLPSPDVKALSQALKLLWGDEPELQDVAAELSELIRDMESEVVAPDTLPAFVYTL
jgi:hypothetical protein